MLLNAAPAQLQPKKPKMPSIMVKKRNSKQILPSSNSLAINSLVVASKKPLQISKKPLNSTLNSLNDPAYLSRLLAYQEENFNKINTTKTKFFPLGTNSSIKTQDIIVFIGMKGGKTQFCKLSDFGVIQFPQIKFPDDLQKLVTGNLIEDFKKVGWIILQGGQLGFLLDLESLEESRKGNFPSHWKNLVGTEFFFHKLKEEKFTAVFRNQYIPPISSCPKITSDMLVLHQKEDVRWMYNLEQNHKFELRETNSPQALFFFDTGYCLTNVQTKLTTAFHSLSFLEIPGGIFNSQTGNGKAASVVELISSETCMKTPRQNSEDQSLIVTSEETLFQWKQEFEKFAPAVRVLVIAELSDWEKLGFEASMNGENTLIKDYQVILAHRKVFELKEKIAPKIFTVNFKRIVLDDIHEVLARYNKRQELFEEMRFAQIQYLNKQENDLSASNGKNNSQFLQVIKDLQKKFLWGVSSACIPAKIAQAFQNLFPINLLNYPPQKTQEINKRFLELHFRTNTVSKEEITTDIEKSVIKVQPYSIHNFYLNPASARDLPDQDMINKIAKTQLAEFRVPDEENNCVSEALEIINYKQQSDIRRIEAETKAENDDRSALFERIEALKGPSSFYAEATQLLRSSEFDCPVCLEDHPTEKITMLSCLHYFCEDCYKQFSETEISKCPVCTKFINAQDLIMHPLYRVSAENKFTFLLKEITGPSSEGKIIIFAHHQSVLETISQSLHQFGVPSYVLKGDYKEISKTLEDFKKSSDVRILLMTVKQGKTGINITEANNVFFLQPLFEADRKKAALVYNQCVGRVMRMGQNKKVNVKLFVTDAFEDHVEDIFMNPWN